MLNPYGKYPRIFQAGDEAGDCAFFSPARGYRSFLFIPGFLIFGFSTVDPSDRSDIERAVDLTYPNTSVGTNLRSSF